MSALRAARIFSGLVLMGFVTGHLVNVALGLISLNAMNAGARVFMAPWGAPPGKAVLIGAGLVHTALGLQAIAARRTLAMRLEDRLQILSGILIPLLLAGHLLTVTSGLETSYAFMLSLYWIYSPLYAIQQLSLLLVVWIHGAIGLVGWARLKAWWPRAAPLVTPLLFAVPILALLGFVEAGKAVLARSAADEMFRVEMASVQMRLMEISPALNGVKSQVMSAFSIVVAVALGIAALRVALNRNAPVRVHYDAGLEGEGRNGLSILEISRLSDVPHASVCSGRGRCGTCRVRVLEGGRVLSPPDEVERRTLRGMDEGGRVRLACRARVLDGAVRVERMLPVHADASAARRIEDWLPPPADHPAGPVRAGALAVAQEPARRDAAEAERVDESADREPVS